MHRDFKELPGFKEMKISPYTLTFKDKEMEKEYAIDYYKKSINQVRVSFFLAIFLYAFLALLDTALQPEYRYIIWVIRFSGVLPIGMLVLVSSFSDSFNQVKSGAIGFAMFMFGLGIILMIYIVPKPVDFSYYASMIITFIFIYFLTGFRFVNATIISLLLLGMYYIMSIYIIGNTDGDLVENNYFFIATNIIGMFGAYSLEFFSKRDFYAATLIEKQNKLLESFNEELEYKVEEKTAALKEEIEIRKNKEQELIKSKEELEKLYHETVAGLGSAVEMRDQSTSGHQIKVSKLSKAIAEKMNLSEDEIEAVTLAAEIHDIGKLNVPAIILNKLTDLTEDERAIMQQHTVAGAKLLRNIDFPWPIADIVNQHHELIDGSGYPDHLKGDEILLPARIICVANVYEAITAYKPYSGTLDTEYAISELKKGSGKIYDEEVVDACLSVIIEDGFEF
jgi:putative nucleotidyltransferase with HDIG domain